MSATQGTSGFGTLLKSGSNSGYSTYVHGSGDAELTFSARVPGTSGDSITITLDATGTNAATVASLSGTDVTVTLRSSSGTPLATALEVFKAVLADYATNGLISCVYGGDGSGTPAALTSTNLASGAAETFTTIAEMKNVSGPNMSMETIDATHMESPSGFREILASFKSGGEVSTDLNFLPAASGHQQLTTDFANRTKRNYQIWWSDSGPTKWQFAAYVTGFQPSATIDDVLGASVTFMITGAPDFDA